jgi:hypothetical protein
MYNRRDLGRLMIAGLAVPLAGFSLRRGEPGLGVRTRGFGDLRRTPHGDPVDALLASIGAVGVRHCELFAPQIEAQFVMSHSHHGMSSMARQMMRRELRKWRLRVPADYFQAIGRRFARAGIAISAFNYSPDASFTDEEIDRGFEMARALGAGMITASATPEVAARIAPRAERQRMVVALEDAGPQLSTAPRTSSYVKVSLGVGDLTAANLDPVGYLTAHHGEIAALRLTDRRRDAGDSRPWGGGDTPIRDVLRLVSREGWPMPRYVDCDYAGSGNAVEEMKKCVAYATEFAI